MKMCKFCGALRFKSVLVEGLFECEVWSLRKQKLMTWNFTLHYFLTVPAPLNRKQNCNMKEHNLRFFAVCCILVTVIFRFSFLISCATTSFIIYPLHSYSFGFVSVSLSVLTFFSLLVKEQKLVFKTSFVVVVLFSADSFANKCVRVCQLTLTIKVRKVGRVAVNWHCLNPEIKEKALK